MNEKELINELLTYIKDHRVIIGDYPMYMNEEMEKASALKRKADYEGAFNIYLELIKKEEIYTKFLSSVYKTVACAGYLKDALEILNIGNDTMNNVFIPSSYPNKFSYHLDNLNHALESEANMKAYLTNISGNNNYQMAKPFAEMVAELKK